MTDFKFELGEHVIVSPTGNTGPLGLVTGQTRYINGSLGYVVSVGPGFAEAPIVRHILSECEMQKLTPWPNEKDD